MNTQINPDIDSANVLTPNPSPKGRGELKRPVRKLVLFLMLGAIVNVAVAWAYAQFSSKPFTMIRAQVLGALEGGMLESTDGYKAFEESQVGVSIAGYPVQEANRQMRVALTAGWPSRSFHSWSQYDGNAWIYGGFHIPLANTPPSSEWWLQFPRKHELPLFPLWPGFAINSVFYAAILWGLFAVPGRVRRWRRSKRGLCPACAYPVRGGQSPTCTECGAAVTPAHLKTASSPSPS